MKLDGTTRAYVQRDVTEARRKRTFVFILAIAVGMLPTVAFAARIHVRGRSRIDASSSRMGVPGRTEGDLAIRGIVSDVAGDAIPKALIRVAITPSDLSVPRTTIDPPMSLRNCVDERETHETLSHPKASEKNVLAAITLTTDETGRFCVRATLPSMAFKSIISWDGSSTHESATFELPIDPARQGVRLQFDPAPNSLPLWTDALRVEATAARETSEGVELAAELPLVLEDERGVRLSDAVTDSRGHADFSFPTALLDAPGRGELRVRFEGTPSLLPSLQSTTIVRITRVSLNAVNAINGALASNESPSEEGVPIEVDVRSSRGIVDSGSVEARIGDLIVGAAPVISGKSTVVATFASSGQRSRQVNLRYVPSVSWFEPGDSLAVNLSTRAISTWRNAPVLAAGTVLLFWMIWIRIRNQFFQTKRSVNLRKKNNARGSAGIALVHAESLSPAQKGRWYGKVLDAHDSSPIANAQVSLERPTFGPKSVIATTFTRDDGAFVLQPESVQLGDELVVNAPFHSLVRRAAPSRGELSITLILRKRAILNRLVQWAKLRGRPFDMAPEPTPGHVREVAASDERLVRWASAVERGAFEGGSLDASAEAEIDRLAPNQSAQGEPSIVVPNSNAQTRVKS